VNIGNIYANNKQFDIAEKYYREALEIRKENVLANVNIGKVFLVRGNFDSAFWYIDYARTLDTLSPEPLHALGMLCVNFGKIPEAVAYLEKVQSLVPNYMNSGETLTQLKSRIQFQDTQISGQGILMLEQKSYELYQQKKYDESVNVLLELVKINPQSAAGYYNNAGMCFLDRDLFDDAEKYFLLSIEKDKNFIAGYNNLATIYEKKGDIKKAEEIRKKISHQ
jgi:tetratricopeptide (TPR) repeat protein